MIQNICTFGVRQDRSKKKTEAGQPEEQHGFPQPGAWKVATRGGLKTTIFMEQSIACADYKLAKSPGSISLEKFVC